MRAILLICAVVIANLYAKINITTFHSTFVQTVTNDQNRTLRYEGEVWFQKSPFTVKWIYKKPNHKEIYITDSQLFIIEPDLEQVVMRKFDKKDDFFSTLDRAVLVKGNRYKTYYQGKDIIIDLKDGKISRVTYTDKLGNKSSIEFIDPVQNAPLNQSVFEVRVERDWDVIKE